MAMYDDHQASSYDVEHAGWSNLPEDDFIQHDDLPFTMGEFIWTVLITLVSQLLITVTGQVTVLCLVQ